MCKKPKAPKTADEPAQVYMKGDLQQESGAAKRRRSGLRLDLNNATTRYQGLTIPGG